MSEVSIKVFNQCIYKNNEEMEQREEFDDADSIHMENDYEVQYWTSQLKVTNDELTAAVAEVGNGIEAVKVYLNKA